MTYALPVELDCRREAGIAGFEPATVSSEVTGLYNTAGCFDSPRHIGERSKFGLPGCQKWDDIRPVIRAGKALGWVKSPNSAPPAAAVFFLISGLGWSHIIVERFRHRAAIGIFYDLIGLIWRQWHSCKQPGFARWPMKFHDDSS